MFSNKTIASTSRPQKQRGAAGTDDGALLTKLNQLMEQIIAEKQELVKEKLKRNRENVERQVSTVMSEISRSDLLQTEENTNQMLLSRIDNPLYDFRGFPQGLVEKDHINNQDRISAATIKIPYLKKLPPYRSWVHMARNQRMPKDESVAGKKQIYYEQHGGETKICSDSEDELKEPKEVKDELKEPKDGKDELKEPKEVKDGLKEPKEVKDELKEPKEAKDELKEPKEAKHEFSEDEDRLLWMALGEFGLQEEVLSTVTLFVGGTISEIQERYEILKERNTRSLDQHSEDSGGSESHTGICLEKSLSAALDSFNNLFCRRCIQIFDCPLHGSSQPLIYHSEKQPVWSEPGGDREPCSDQCYLLLKDVKILSGNSAQGSFQDKKIKVVEEVEGILAPSSSKEPGNQSTKSIFQEERCNYVTTPFTTEIYCRGDPNSDVPVSKSRRKRKKVINLSDSTLCHSPLPPDDSQNSCKNLTSVSDAIVTANGNGNRDLNLDASLKSHVEHTSNKLIVSGRTCHGEHDEGVEDGQKHLTNEIEFKQSSNSTEVQASETPRISDWKLLEKELYLKGVEMFGRNSCLIARNLLSGLKTCMEVATYMYAGGESTPHGSIPLPGSIMDKNERINRERKDQEMPSKSRLLRKRSKPRKFKHTRKSAGLPSIWRRIAYGQTLCNKQYTPCGCHGMCGKQCPCLVNGSLCEKYCGCSKSCNHRYSGCHCTRSQCRSRHCPCFAARRECDPDVCLSCWISCGDGSLGEPPGRDSQCVNMILLSGQKQRILLAKSDVAGWGAFTKNPVKKNDCLGEYTGELITQKEADKRGKLYDLTNSSFLFDLNDQYVVDAIRKGDKLKFANHSIKPNCYPKVVLVAGDHRIGIFAGENIQAGAELFYDYSYAPEQSPQWILGLKGEPSKKGESAVSHGKAKKRQSHS